MTPTNMHDDTSVMNAEIWVWIWFFASTIAVGVMFGNIFGSSDGRYSDDTSFGWGPFFGGIVVGLVANIPFMALFDVVKKLLAVNKDVLANTVATRKHTARIPLPSEDD